MGVTNQATSKEKDFWQDLCREVIILGLKCLANNMPPKYTGRRGGGGDYLEQCEKTPVCADESTC